MTKSAQPSQGHQTPARNRDVEVLTVTGINHFYGSRRALSDVGLSLRAGSTTGLIGRNGSGKTTLLRILSGSLHPAQGDVTLRRGARRGLVPDTDGALPPELTPRSYLNYLRRLGNGRTAMPVEDALSMVGLTEVSDRYLSTLSRGYRQRVLIAQGLLDRPEVLLLDEPFNSLDPAQIDELSGVLRALPWRPAVLLSSHVMAHLKTVVDAFVVLRKGAVAHAGPVREFYGRDEGSQGVGVSIMGSEQALRKALRTELKIASAVERRGVVEATVVHGNGSRMTLDELTRAVMADVAASDVQLVGIEARAPRLSEML